MTNRPSYEKVNYTLRPAKNIERKMIAEACARLSIFRPVNTYRYVGFGSPFFSDFRLFHRILGFQEMVNIEAEIADSERFDFNRPFGCIDMKYGRSSEVLSTLAWKGLPTVIWLDYDCQLSSDILDDIEWLAAILEKSSLMIITVRSKPGDFGKGSNKIDEINLEFGERLPAGIRQRDLTKRRFPETVRLIVNSTIADVLAGRNSATSNGERIEYRQIFNFIYNDGTPMLTLGGVLSETAERDKFESCGFDSLDFCRSGSDAYTILAPLLTFKEQRNLDSQLPGSSVETPGVNVEDIEAYSRVYRYFPAFTEAEL